MIFPVKLSRAVRLDSALVRPPGPEKRGPDIRLRFDTRRCLVIKGYVRVAKERAREIYFLEIRRADF